MKKRPGILAKVAMQTSSLFSDAAKALQQAEGVSVLNPVKEQCLGKMMYFKVRSCIFYVNSIMI